MSQITDIGIVMSPIPAADKALLCVEKALRDIYRWNEYIKVVIIKSKLCRSRRQNGLCTPHPGNPILKWKSTASKRYSIKFVIFMYSTIEALENMVRYRTERCVRLNLWIFPRYLFVIFRDVYWNHKVK